MNKLHISQKQKGKRVEISVDDKNALITERSYFKTTSVPINIDLIDPTPIEYKSVSSRSLIFGGVLAFFAFAFLITGLMAEDGNGGGFYFIAAFIGAFSIGNFVTAYTGLTDVYLFTNKHNGQNLFAVSKLSPSRKAAASFVKDLEAHLSKIRYPSHIAPEQKAEIYMRHLAFLLEENVISEKVFNEAAEALKNRIKPAPVMKLV